ncbi:hypothetical protein [Komagataeibacter sp. NFXK3]
MQSTTLALMAAQDEIGPMPDCAIFADTGWEPQAVYDHLSWLRSPHVLLFPVHIVSTGNLRDDLLGASRGGRWASIPAYTRGNADDRDDIGMIRRQCTTEYKIAPIRKKVRALAGLTRKRSPREPFVEQWMGISFEEITRIKMSREAWQVNRWPLIEKRMTRRDCLRWLESYGYPRPPKSSCLGCPFHSDAAWRAIRKDHPEEWEDVVAVDRAIRRGLRGIRGEVFLHRSATPLETVPLTACEKTGQTDLFLDECDGVCGV